ncbi:MAG: ATP-binding protein [Chloroflexota bacterium]
MTDQSLAAGLPPRTFPQPWGRRLATGALLWALATAAVVGAVATTEPGQPYPWVQPAAESICVVTLAALAYLCLERHRTRRAPLAWWCGLVFVAALIANVFYILTFPGLVGQGGVIGAAPSTSAYFFALQYAVLGGGIVFAVVCARRRIAPQGKAAQRRQLLITLAGALALCTLVVALAETGRLPVLVDASGFTATNRWLTRGLTLLLLAAGALVVPQTSRYRPWLSRPLLLCLAVSTAITLATEFPVQRYDGAWYAVRLLRPLAFGLVFIALLREYAGLYRDERLRAETQAGLAAAAGELAALQSPAEIVRALGRRLRLLVGGDRSVAVFVLAPGAGGAAEPLPAVPAYAEGVVAAQIMAAGPRPSTEGLIGHVLRTRRPHTSVGPDHAIGVPVPGAPNRPGAVLAVPILGSSRPLGVAILTREAQAPYGELEVEAANLFAHQAAAALERAYQAEAIDRMKSEFVSLVSHELRTPLTSIVGYVDLLLEPDAEPLSEEQREFLEVARNNAARLTGLIEDLLDLSRIEAGRIELRLTDLDVAEEATQIAASLHRQIAAKGQTLTVNLPERPPRVKADRARLQQVLVNLLSNAHKYTPDGGAICLDVAATLEGQAVRIAVRDTGIGMSEADLAHLFERFYRARNDATLRERGTGLGLSITKSLVELMGGRMGVQSAPGKGSTFSFTLPAADLIP